MTVNFTVVERARPPGADRYAWRAFDPDTRFTRGWWSPDYFSDGTNYINIAVLLGDVEVARVELDQTVEIDHYESTPVLGPNALEIQFIDVAGDRRGQGIGTEVVRLLEARYPDRRLVAFSEEADRFWASLGWDSYMHPERGPHWRTLFIQPPQGTRNDVAEFNV